MATRDEIYTAIRNADAAGDTASVQKLGAYLQTMGAAPAAAPPAAPSSMADRAVNAVKNDVAAIPGKIGNLAAGAVRGAGSIGATILAPVDMVSDAMDGKGLSLDANRQRRADMDATLKDFGADPNSPFYKTGKILTEVAGTAGAGGAVANGARALGAAPELVSAIGSGGFSGGGNALVRAAGGAINGAATAGLVDPHEAPAGFVIGGALPGAVQLAGKAGNAIYDAAKGGARSLMQSAIKPTLAQRSSGDADTAIDTMLQYGINPTKAGVNKIKGLIDDLNSQIGNKISGSTAVVDKQKVMDRLDDVRSLYRNQVSPTKDINAIEGVSADFASHPQFPLPQTGIPVQDAQKLKQGTYRVLQGKYGGEIGSAETEAQKGLARGLKEEIATAVPEVGPLNAEESRLIKTLDVAERRALLEMNKNPLGLTLLAHDPIAAAGFFADRSAAFKALAARFINNAAAPAAGYAGQKAIGAAGNPLLRAAGVDAISANP